MCTVTYFPLRNKTVLTSNRDEKPYRSAQEIHREKGIFYPKDPAKNGTWFAVTKSGNAIVLLNGAFKNHQRKADYRKSRGIIVLDLIAKENILKSLELIDLENIEPFTLVIFRKNELTEFRWNGTEKHFKKLDIHQPCIWSSATLYDEEAQEKRNTIFKEFLENQTTSEEKIWDFHHQKTDDLENGITIKRQNTIQTISTTQLVISDTITLKHQNRLHPNSNSEKIFWQNEPETSLS
ncbi:MULTISPECIES: NRDE family protein [Chryseobacterium]|uniref:Uncharacterized conserved protein n=1 Tax=Chryseobacterium taihuense TaxID=1141221 RepID=A0A4U8WEE5_9FLAO|nr:MULTISPECIES: NRDE family protein [Chryseobacterium]QQV02010.1 NRDE family protein [Chryseobacterium sp. FDAARGOS 1104]VFB04762.1 Uncharacterized conserved protein [Chryseobacterium taihuense]